MRRMRFYIFNNQKRSQPERLFLTQAGLLSAFQAKQKGLIRFRGALSRMKADFANTQVLHAWNQAKGEINHQYPATKHPDLPESDRFKLIWEKALPNIQKVLQAQSDKTLAWCKEIGLTTIQSSRLKKGLIDGQPELQKYAQEAHNIQRWNSKIAAAINFEQRRRRGLNRTRH